MESQCLLSILKDPGVGNFTVGNGITGNEVAGRQKPQQIRMVRVAITALNKWPRLRRRGAHVSNASTEDSSLVDGMGSTMDAQQAFEAMTRHASRVRDPLVSELFEADAAAKQNEE